MRSLLHETPPRSALVVAAHPDDIEFMAGGTLATWIDQGTRAHYLLITDGAGGSRDPRVTPAQLGARRRHEQRAAAEILGAASVTFLDYRDATLEPNQELRLAIARVIRQVRPAAVLTFDPHVYYTGAGINHPDHVAVGVSTLGAVMPLANTRLAAPALIEEGLEPHDVEAVYLFQPAAPTDWMPLSAEVMERKVAALRAHASQLEQWDGAACAYDFARAAARSAQTGGVRCGLAEAFTRIQLADAPARLPIGRRLRLPAPSGAGLVARSMQLAAASFGAAFRLR